MQLLLDRAVWCIDFCGISIGVMHNSSQEVEKK